MVILRSVRSLWDFLFKSYECFSIIIFCGIFCDSEPILLTETFRPHSWALVRTLFTLHLKRSPNLISSDISNALRRKFSNMIEFDMNCSEELGSQSSPLFVNNQIPAQRNLISHEKKIFLRSSWKCDDAPIFCQLTFVGHNFLLSPKLGNFSKTL